MNKASNNHPKTEPRLRLLLTAALVLTLLLAAVPFGFTAQAARGVTYKVEITTESKAAGWISATLRIGYKSGSFSPFREIKNDLAAGNTYSYTFELTDEVPHMLRMHLDFGGGFTIRSHSGRIKFYANDEELVNEPYSARSYPFSSSDATLDFGIWGIAQTELITSGGTSTMYPTVRQAWKQAQQTNGCTVKLREDASVTGTLEVANSAAFDLNGHLISNSETTPLFLVKAGGSLSIKDSDPQRDTGETYLCSAGLNGADDVQARTYHLKGGGVYHGGNEGSGGAVKVEKGGVLSVEGCTFTDIHAAEDGGAIYCEGSATLKDTTFIHCTAENSGGAIYTTGNPNINADNLTFEWCEADTGGGFCVSNVKTNTQLGALNNCTFRYCKAKSSGGGLRLATRVEVETDNLAFYDCWAEYGGGAYNSASCPVTFDNALFENCTADYGGGFVYNAGGKMTMTNAEFNRCSAAECGGGLYLMPVFPYLRYTHSADAKFDNCSIHDCAANEEGGGIYVYDDGNDTDELNKIIINKASVQNNTAKKGGGLYVESHFVYLVDSTVTNNQASGKHGGGVYVDSMRDIDLAGEVVIRSNSAKGEPNNLCLQNGSFSSAKMYSGGLYDGSYIGISSTSGSGATVGKNMSEYQVLKFLHADDSSRGFSMADTKEVATPLFASMISGNVSAAILIGGGVLIVGTVGILIFRKQRKEGKKHDEQSKDGSC